MHSYFFCFVLAGVSVGVQSLGVMPYTAMACVVMSYIVMAYTVMADIIMAFCFAWQERAWESLFEFAPSGVEHVAVPPKN